MGNIGSGVESDDEEELSAEVLDQTIQEIAKACVTLESLSTLARLDPKAVVPLLFSFDQRIIFPCLISSTGKKGISCTNIFKRSSGLISRVK